MRILNTERNRRFGYQGGKAKLIAKSNGLCFFEIEKDGKPKLLKCSDAMFISNFIQEEEESELLDLGLDEVKFDKKSFVKY